MAINRDYKKSSSSKSSNPMLTGLVIGILIGLAIALAVALYINAAPSPFRQPPKPAQTAPEAKPGAAAPAHKADAKANGQQPEAQKNRFTYYDILPGTEKPVTDQEIQQAPPDKKDQYFLQAGSFPNEVDANNLKAKLALLGVEAVIQSASVPDKGVWHRVRVGPFNDIEEMNKARAMLSQNGIQPSLIKVLENPPAKP
jgi:cell division protein FtsN